MGAKFSSGGGATVFYDKTDTPGEIVRELVNASDGAGLNFDGSAGYIDIASPPDLGTKLSFEFVCKVDDPSGTQNGLLVDFGGGSGRAIFGASSSISGNFGIYYNSAWATFGLNPLTDGRVHHLIASIDGTTATLYDNGNQIATATIGSLNIDGCTDARIGTNFVATGGFFGGTIYRARFYNRTLSADDVRTAYERADVDFADQYGSASNLITNGNFETNTSGWTSENTSVFQRNTTSPISGTGDLKWTGDGSGYPSAISNSFSLTAGKKYRIKFTYRVTGGTVYLKFGKTAGATSAAVAGISEVALTAASNTAYEATVTPTESTTAYIVFRGNNNTTPTMFVDLVDFVQIGCVSDYDLAYAQPALSTLIQDRSGAADGVASSSGVTQVQPITQLNSTSARIGSTQLAAGTAPYIPADGSIVASGQIKTRGGALATPSFAFEEEAGLGMSRPTANTLNFITSSEERMRISSTGQVNITGTTSFPETSEHPLLVKAGMANGLSNRYIKLQQTYTGSANDGIPIVWETNADGADNKSYGYIRTKADGTVAIGNKAAGAAVAVGTALGTTEHLSISSTGQALFTGSKVTINTDGTIDWGNAADAGRLTWDTNDAKIRGVAGKNLKLGANNTDFVTIDTGGLCTFSGGINLGNSTLSNYEQGTFTATLNGGTAEPATLVTATANYTRVGDRVFFSIGFEGVDTTGYSGAITISGLPFANAGVVRSPISVITYDSATWTSGSQAAAFIGRNHSYVSMYAFESGGVWNALQHDAGTGRYFWLNGTYKTAAA